MAGITLRSPTASNKSPLHSHAPHRVRHLQEHRLRLLRTLAQRERHRQPAPTAEWFSESAWETVLDLTAEGLLTRKPAVRLTAAGRRFIDA